MICGGDGATILPTTKVTVIHGWISFNNQFIPPGHCFKCIHMWCCAEVNPTGCAESLRPYPLPLIPLSPSLTAPKPDVPKGVPVTP
ncbi:hypothetical protein ACN38_g9606 [Penicillium nordicum]|uniref:Uncharacterized protein n=1 Tax=Penicillium nordicum TaxID=229535 RepID=A0A0M8NXZ2_9EURO|nr:hypothetical protein ACN38_g9606 [Penicillium nordicum]